jgi:hypothetical protein
MVPDGSGPRVKRRISKNKNKNVLFIALAYILECKSQGPKRKKKRTKALKTCYPQPWLRY